MNATLKYLFNNIMKEEQDRYFQCLEVCVEDEQGMSCRQVCAPILNDDPVDHPTVPLIN